MLFPKDIDKYPAALLVQRRMGRGIWLLLLSVLIPAGCERRLVEESESGRIRIVASVGMVADLVRRLVDDDVEVSQMMGSGVDPHLYQATRDDIRSLISADLIVAVGLHLEGRLQDTFQRLQKSRPVLFLGDSVPQDRLLAEEGSAGVPDPHLWMDVSLWSLGLAALEDQLCRLLPQATERISVRRVELERELLQLHEYGVRSVQTIPETRRVLVTSHDAFRYFGRAYGLEVLGIQGISTDSEAGLFRMNQLVDILVEREIAAVFVESSVPRRSIEALIEGAADRGVRVRIGGELFSDAMGPAGTFTGTYPGMLDHNLTTVALALGGQAPKRGHAGRLSAGGDEHD